MTWPSESMTSIRVVTSISTPSVNGRVVSSQICGEPRPVRAEAFLEPALGDAELPTVVVVRAVLVTRVVGPPLQHALLGLVGELTSQPFVEAPDLVDRVGLERREPDVVEPVVAPLGPE